MCGLPAFALPNTLPEMRACFQEAKRIEVASLGGANLVNHSFFEMSFGSVCDQALARLAKEDVVVANSNRWQELYGAPVNSHDTLLLGIRACIITAAPVGEFRHRYIAWSKVQQRAVAQGGLTIHCEGIDGHRVPLPTRWVNRMELDFGETWASTQIVEFRRGTGLPTRVGEGMDADSSDNRLERRPQP